jgi:RES domain-containing protein
VIYPPEWLDRLQGAPEISWDGTVFRHMFGDIPPVKTNIAGARWNPPDVEAIYTSCEQETALAEAEYYLSLHPLRPKAKRVLYAIRLTLQSVLDLRDFDRLSKLGMLASTLAAADVTECRRLGGAVAWLRYEGMLIPSARRDGGTNLVIYRQDLSGSFEIVETRVIQQDAR